MEVGMKSAKNFKSTKERLISFYKRHHSSGGLSLLKPLASSNKMIVHSSSSSKSLLETQSGSEVASENQRQNTRHSLSPIPQHQSVESLKSRLKCINSALTAIEEQTAALKLKEKELADKETQLTQQEKEIETVSSRLWEQVIKVTNKEREVERLERQYQNRKERIFQEVSNELDKKYKSVELKQTRLQSCLSSLSHMMKTLTKEREDSALMECTAFLNELIGMVVLSDLQHRIDANIRELDDFSENLLFHQSFNGLERIDELSNESSQSESYNLDHCKAADVLFTQFSNLPNPSASSKSELEAIISSFSSL
jgi:chromosome segregation ATPase